LRYLLRLAGIKRKKISLHSFRHSRATELAGMMNEFQMCRFFGWSMGSAMPATYIREQALDVRGALMAGYGLEKQERTKEVVGVACLQCEHRNPSGADYCDNCNLPLDPKHLAELRKGAQALQGRELAKQYAMELKQEVIREVLAELKNAS
jgi:integrase/recombinase XerD